MELPLHPPHSLLRKEKPLYIYSGASASRPAVLPDHVHCSYCGQQLAPHTNRCFNCGRTSPFQYLPIYSNPDEEMCEIKWFRKAVGPLYLTNRIFFQAEAIGPEGREVIATSGPAPDRTMDFAPEGSPVGPFRIPTNSEQSVAAYEELESTLRADGWEPKEQGLYWWPQWFRRPLYTDPQPEPESATNNTTRQPPTRRKKSIHHTSPRKRKHPPTFSRSLTAQP